MCEPAHRLHVLQPDVYKRQMYAMGGQFLPSVMHIASRVVTSNHLSIFGDHTDFMTCRTTGYAMLMSCALDSAGVDGRRQRRSKYGAKRPKAGK